MPTGPYASSLVGEYVNACSFTGMYGGDSTPESWVEAENVMKVRELVCGWFNAMESGEANNRYPDPYGKAISQQKADKFIKELDDDFNKESGRFEGLSADVGPEFFRLKPHARLAFAQEFFSLVMTKAQIKKEAKRRVKAGVKFPAHTYGTYEVPNIPAAPILQVENSGSASTVEARTYPMRFQTFQAWDVDRSGETIHSITIRFPSGRVARVSRRGVGEVVWNELQTIGRHEESLVES